ncbi:uncharacterized protein LOC108666434 isoform X2 [Hyalella azteca]|uniref:Uncharacterized protein LOC108666434 isoform X2 n=1 Tax=Hyalella azteca TaxID=294128 RepID=A0A979FUK3_HYAAZ|nr:uncharacterized protein LOC108666434 isoform X2 [Hyalella azteca]
MDETQNLSCTQTFFDEAGDEDASKPPVTCWLEIAGVKHELVFGENKIGRNPKTCQVLLRNAVSVSKEHAVLHVGFGCSTLVDLASRNKTRLGKQILCPHIQYAITGGAMLQFGVVKAKFITSSDSDNNMDVTGNNGLRPERDTDSSTRALHPDEQLQQPSGTPASTTAVNSCTPNSRQDDSSPLLKLKQGNATNIAKPLSLSLDNQFKNSCYKDTNVESSRKAGFCSPSPENEANTQPNKSSQSVIVENFLSCTPVMEVTRKKICSPFRKKGEKDRIYARKCFFMPSPTKHVVEESDEEGTVKSDDSDSCDLDDSIISPTQHPTTSSTLLMINKTSSLSVQGGGPSRAVRSPEHPGLPSVVPETPLSAHDQSSASAGDLSSLIPNSQISPATPSFRNPMAAKNASHNKNSTRTIDSFSYRFTEGYNSDAGTDTDDDGVDVTVKLHDEIAATSKVAKHGENIDKKDNLTEKSTPEIFSELTQVCRSTQSTDIVNSNIADQNDTLVSTQDVLEAFDNQSSDAAVDISYETQDILSAFDKTAEHAGKSVTSEFKKPFSTPARKIKKTCQANTDVSSYDEFRSIDNVSTPIVSDLCDYPTQVYNSPPLTAEEDLSLASTQLFTGSTNSAEMPTQPSIPEDQDTFSEDSVSDLCTQIFNENSDNFDRYPGMQTPVSRSQKLKRKSRDGALTPRLLNTTEPESPSCLPTQLFTEDEESQQKELNESMTSGPHNLSTNTSAMASSETLKPKDLQSDKFSVSEMETQLYSNCAESSNTHKLLSIGDKTLSEMETQPYFGSESIEELPSMTESEEASAPPAELEESSCNSATQLYVGEVIAEDDGAVDVDATQLFDSASNGSQPTVAEGSHQQLYDLPTQEMLEEENEEKTSDRADESKCDGNPRDGDRTLTPVVNGALDPDLPTRETCGIQGSPSLLNNDFCVDKRMISDSVLHKELDDMDLTPSLNPDARLSHSRTVNAESLPAELPKFDEDMDTDSCNSSIASDTLLSELPSEAQLEDRVMANSEPDSSTEFSMEKSKFLQQSLSENDENRENRNFDRTVESATYDKSEEPELTSDNQRTSRTSDSLGTSEIERNMAQESTPEQDYGADLSTDDEGERADDSCQQLPVTTNSSNQDSTHLSSVPANTKAENARSELNTSINLSESTPSATHVDLSRNDTTSSVAPGDLPMPGTISSVSQDETSVIKSASPMTDIGLSVTNTDLAVADVASSVVDALLVAEKALSSPRNKKPVYLPSTSADKSDVTPTLGICATSGRDSQFSACEPDKTNAEVANTSGHSSFQFGSNPYHVNESDSDDGVENMSVDTIIFTSDVECGEQPDGLSSPAKSIASSSRKTPERVPKILCNSDDEKVTIAANPRQSTLLKKKSVLPKSFVISSDEEEEVSATSQALFSMNMCTVDELNSSNFTPVEETINKSDQASASSSCLPSRMSTSGSSSQTKSTEDTIACNKSKRLIPSRRLRSQMLANRSDEVRTSTIIISSDSEEESENLIIKYEDIYKEASRAKKKISSPPVEALDAEGERSFDASAAGTSRATSLVSGKRTRGRPKRMNVKNGGHSSTQEDSLLVNKSAETNGDTSVSVVVVKESNEVADRIGNGVGNKRTCSASSSNKFSCRASAATNAGIVVSPGPTTRSGRTRRAPSRFSDYATTLDKQTAHSEEHRETNVRVNKKKSKSQENICNESKLVDHEKAQVSETKNSDENIELNIPPSSTDLKALRAYRTDIARNNSANQRDCDHVVQRSLPVGQLDVPSTSSSAPSVIIFDAVSSPSETDSENEATEMSNRKTVTKAIISSQSKVPSTTDVAAISTRTTRSKNRASIETSTLLEGRPPIRKPKGRKSVAVSSSEFKIIPRQNKSNDVLQNNVSDLNQIKDNLISSRTAKRSTKYKPIKDATATTSGEAGVRLNSTRASARTSAQNSARKREALNVVSEDEDGISALKNGSKKLKTTDDTGPSSQSPASSQSSVDSQESQSSLSSASTVVLATNGKTSKSELVHPKTGAENRKSDNLGSTDGAMMLETAKKREYPGPSDIKGKRGRPRSNTRTPETKPEARDELNETNLSIQSGESFASSIGRRRQGGSGLPRRSSAASTNRRFASDGLEETNLLLSSPAERQARANTKPRVLFTGTVPSPENLRTVKKLGGVVVQSAMQCSVLVS